jgi:hypothetical protein
VFIAVRRTKSSRSGCVEPVVVPLVTSSISFFWFRLSAASAAAVLSVKSASDVIDGTRAGAPVSASGAVSLPSAERWKPGNGFCLSALPSQPSVSVFSVLAACQMSIDRKCDWSGFG